ncbi:MAG: 2-amino-4-hydroxy-6-hydroxymethyldihydropteridine diphosphokinase [Planctomycetaceae bacterium]
MSHRAFISLGSNIDPARHLPAAVRELSLLGEISRVSQAWCSSPVGDPDQADFCNAAVLLITEHSMEELLGAVGLLRGIESRLGRVRDPANKNAPRTIDLDLSLFDEFAGEVLGKRIPDPDLFKRAFVAVPLAELDADYSVPGADRALRSIAAALLETAGPIWQSDLSLDTWRSA